VFRRVGKLLARPMTASQLDPETLEAFAANLLVNVLQTIGRGLRKSMPVEVYFVDAAWAPESANGRPDSERSSVLVGMRNVLLGCLNTPDPVQLAVYREVYGPFEEGFREIGGLVLSTEVSAEPTEDLRPSPAGLEDAMDGFDPDADAASTEEAETDAFEDLIATPPLDDEPVDPEDAGAEAAWAKYEQGYAHPRSEIENEYRAQDAHEAETGGVAL
jgi:hypothetical protein